MMNEWLTAFSELAVFKHSDEISSLILEIMVIQEMQKVKKMRSEGKELLERGSGCQVISITC